MTKRKSILNMNFVRTFRIGTWLFQQLPCDSLFIQVFMEKKVTFISLHLSLEMKVNFKMLFWFLTKSSNLRNVSSDLKFLCGLFHTCVMWISYGKEWYWYSFMEYGLKYLSQFLPMRVSLLLLMKRLAWGFRSLGDKSGNGM